MKTLQERVHTAPKPDSWKLDKLHRVLRVRQGFKNVGMVEDNLLSLSYGRIKRKDIDGAGGLLPESFETYQIVEPGNIVMRLTDLQNDKRSIRQGLVTERGIITSAYDALEATKGNEARFWAYALLALDLAKYYYSLGGGVRQSIKFSDFPNDWVYLPDLATQKQIADFLDAETVRIDALIEKKQRLVTILEERLDQLVRALVTGQASANGHDHELLESGIDYLGQVPKAWCINKVGLRYHIQLGKMLDDSKQTGQYKRPYLRVADVQWGQINTENLPEMDFRPSDQKKFALRKGDLVVNEGGSYVGRSAIWNGELAVCYYQKALHRVRALKPAADSVEFLYYIMRFATKAGVFVAGGNQTTIDHLTAEAFGRYRFAFPKFDEQQEIATALRHAEMKQAALQTSIEASIIRLREYRAALITAAVTGQIDVTAHARPAETVPRLAGADVVPLQPSPQPTSLPDRRTVRVLVAAEVVQRLGADPYLGRIKLQKLMFLAEAHANINEIDGRYERYRAGPYDGAMMPEIEAGMRQEQFYAATEDATSDRRRITFQRMPRAGDHRDALSATLGDRVASLRSMVDLFKDMNTEATEAVATLYAVWNDALIDGQQLDDAAIIRGFLQEWHKDKDKFRQSNLQHWLGWMHRKGIVPRGAGPRTISTSTPSLFEGE